MALRNSCHTHQRDRWKKVKARLKVVAVVALVTMLITPLRNLVMPFLYWDWPALWNELHSAKLAWILLSDLFYYMDRTPYQGTCAHILPHLEPLKKLRVDEFRSYSADDFQQAVDKLKPGLSEEDLWKLDHFKPTITPQEQREMRFALLTLTSALDIFNFTYSVGCGTLIGAFRHHGFIPWDDDADVVIRASEWRQAKEVLSCVPDFSLSIGRDYMWKFMWNKSQLWKGEDYIRFPFIDIFPYNEDDRLLWPLTIWMKWDILWRKAETFPTTYLPFEGHQVRVPKDPAAVLANNFGDVKAMCGSRKFKRKERQSFPYSERVLIPCSMLHEIYPFIFPRNVSEGGRTVSVRELRQGTQVLRVYKP